MNDGYHIDLHQYSLDQYKATLESIELLPGRRILKDYLAERFEILKSNGINNLYDLLEGLKSEARLDKLVIQTGIPRDYLVILRREAGSLIHKPLILREIPGISGETLNRLDKLGIKTTRQMFSKGSTRINREELAQKSGIMSKEINELAALSNLARLYGVGPIFARILLDAGIDSLDKLIYSDPEILYKKLITVNEQHNYTKIMASLKDVNFCVAFAKTLPRALEK